jgi:hypothetical protein
MFKTKLLYLIMLFFLIWLLVNGNPADYLSAQFQRNAGKLFELKCQRTLLPYVFGNPVRNRANDVDYASSRS